MGDLKPSHTLYLNNLDAKISSEELKKLLHAAFSMFGHIVEVKANRKTLRGQAFVVFKEVESAVDAMKVLQGQPFLDKPLRIQFARQESKVIAMAKGDYKWERSVSFRDFLCIFGFLLERYLQFQFPTQEAID